MDENAPLAEAAPVGVAKIVCTLLEGRSVLSTVAHRQPVRVQPLPSALSAAAGAACAVLSSLGGGLLGGDVVEVDVDVGAGATLWFGSQSSNKIYRKKRRRGPTRVDARYRVAGGGLLVVAPDPTVPYARSRYRGTTRLALDEDARAVVVEWLGSGRAAAGERWAFDEFAAEVAVFRGEECLCVDAVSLGGGDDGGADVGGVPRDHVATLYCRGCPGVAAVAATRRSRSPSPAAPARAGAAPRTTRRIASSRRSAATRSWGRRTPGGGVVVARRGRRAEDVYRILAAVLAPLEADLGFRPYADRVAATKSRGGVDDARIRAPRRAAAAASRPRATTRRRAFALAVRSTTATLHAPFLAAAHAAGRTAPPSTRSARASTRAPPVRAPARASRRLGTALRRLSAELVGLSGPPRHAAVAFGALAAAAGVEVGAALLAFEHAQVRDVFSAAVRLGLVGPLKAAKLQFDVAKRPPARRRPAVADAANAAPMLDAIHCCHAQLDMRLFQT
ncbi:urease accessory protein F [Aureococcus anophagefferens]|uniref:Urease accessory protein F n=1 Tax=Aureococcus anophagefferens TaxID=44056 RepID=A0ABR1FKC3_AURAN